MHDVHPIVLCDMVHTIESHNPTLQTSPLEWMDGTLVGENTMKRTQQPACRCHNQTCLRKAQHVETGRDMAQLGATEPPR